MYTALLKYSQYVINADNPAFYEFTIPIRDAENKITGSCNKKGEVIICPGCKYPLRTKNGETNGYLVQNHYAHISGFCPFTKPETPWHREWKACSGLPAHLIEVPFPNNCADMITQSRTVLEPQHSGITPTTINNRHSAYRAGNEFFNRDSKVNEILSDDYFMLFDAENADLEIRSFNKETKVFTFRWRHPRKPWLAMPPGRMILDLGEDEQIGRVLLFVLSHPKQGWRASHGPCIISAKAITKSSFIKHFIQDPEWNYSRDIKKLNFYLGNLVHSNRLRPQDRVPSPASEEERRAYSHLELSPAFVLGPEGPIADQFDKYEARPAQIFFSKCVRRAMEKGYHYFGEAGTGIGKSFALAIPAIERALKFNDGPVIISTETLTLQDQIFNDDIPALKEYLNIPDLKVALRKGRNNYLSRRRFFKLDNSWELKESWKNTGASEEQFGGYIDSVRQHISAYRPGSRDSFSVNKLPMAKIWKESQSNSNHCLGKSCHHYNRCYYYRAVREAAVADIIITNHTVVMYDAKLKDSGKEGLLPSYKYLIFDEAQTVKDVAKKVYTFNWSKTTMDYINRLASGLFKDIPLNPYANIAESILDSLVDLDTLCGDFFDQLKPFFEKRNPRREEKEYICGSINTGSMLSILVKLSDLCRTFVSLIPRKNNSDDFGSLSITGDFWESDYQKTVHYIDGHEIPEELIENRLLYKKFKELMDDFHSDISRALASQNITDPYDSYVSTIGLEKNELFLSSQPVFAKNILSRTIFDKVFSIICTSATLSFPNRGEVTAKEMENFGVSPEKAKTSLIKPIFDYGSSVTMFINAKKTPKIPNRYDRDYERKLNSYYEEQTANCKKSIDLSQGNTMILCTSYQDVNAYYERLRPLYPDFIYYQGGSLSKKHMIDAFKRNWEETTLLIATKSFWTGVDIPGVALRNIIIPKLPFDRPTALVEKRKELYKTHMLGNNYFIDYPLKDAVFAFMQGFGRLIRRKDDVGIVTVLDNRLLYKKYGTYFLSCFQTTPRIIHDHGATIEELRPYLPVGFERKKETIKIFV